MGKAPAPFRIRAHLERRHGLQPSWFEELGPDADLEAAHALDHARRTADHQLGDLDMGEVVRA